MSEQKEPTPLVVGIACFSQVEEVIGRERAIVELEKVMNTPAIVADDPELEGFKTQMIGAAFIWDETPQGQQFWEDIVEGIDPENPSSNSPQVFVPTIGDPEDPRNPNLEPKYVPDHGTPEAIVYEDVDLGVQDGYVEDNGIEPAPVFEDPEPTEEEKEYAPDHGKDPAPVDPEPDSGSSE